MMAIGRITGCFQVGKSWGAAKNPDCSGFTLAQLENLRLDAIDFSEFFSSIQLPSKTATYAVDRLNAKAKSYYAP